MTTWGVGTGRCGTKSLAADLHGLHEPEPRLDPYASKWWGYGSYRKEILDILQHRMTLNIPVVDLHQSFVIPLIREIDKNARFSWVIREPESCVKSFLDRGCWSETWESKTDHLIKPKFGWLPNTTREAKAYWYWITCNDYIAETTLPTKRYIILTEDLENHIK